MAPTIQLVVLVVYAESPCYILSVTPFFHGCVDQSTDATSIFAEGRGTGLVDALRWLARQMEDVHGLEVELRTGHAFSREDANVRVLLFQIMRELLFNVVP